MSHPQGSQSTMHRYKLRSTSASAPSPTPEDDPAGSKTGAGGSDSDMECATVRPSTSSDDPPSKKPKLRRKTKSSLSKKSPFIPIAVVEPIEVDFADSSGDDISKTIKDGLAHKDIGILVNNVGVILPFPMYFHEVILNFLKKLVSSTYNFFILIKSSFWFIPFLSGFFLDDFLHFYFTIKPDFFMP